MAAMHRWRFNMKTGTFKEEQIDDISTDFPRVDDSLVGYGCRFSYNARFAKMDDGQPPAFEGINKYDLKTGRMESHLHGKERYGGEPVFVPDPNGEGRRQRLAGDVRVRRDRRHVRDGRRRREAHVTAHRWPASWSRSAYRTGSTGRG